MPTAAPGFKIWNQGPPGTGKTHAIGTLVADWRNNKWVPHENPRVKVFVNFTEQSQEILAGIPPSHLEWAYTPPTTTSPADLLAKTQKLVSQDWDFIIKGSDSTKKNCDAISALGQNLVNFVSDRTGTEYGSPADWDTSRVYVLDGATGLNRMARAAIIGTYIYMSQPQWGAAQQVEHSWLLLMQNLPCHVIINSHIDRRFNEVTGETLIQPKLLGQALGPEVGGDATDLILSYRSNGNYYWSTDKPSVDTKARLFPLRAELFQNYQPVLTEWERRFSTPSQ